MKYKIGDKVVITDGVANSLDEEDTGKIVTIKNITKNIIYFLACELNRNPTDYDDTLFYAYIKHIRPVTKLEKALK